MEKIKESWWSKKISYIFISSYIVIECVIHNTRFRHKLENKMMLARPLRSLKKSGVIGRTSISKLSYMHEQLQKMRQAKNKWMNKKEQKKE